MNDKNNIKAKATEARYGEYLHAVRSGAPDEVTSRMINQTQEMMHPKGLKKVGDPPKRKVCLHPAHNPPAYMVYKPGVYEYTCSGCGHITNFTVDDVTY